MAAVETLGSGRASVKQVAAKLGFSAPAEPSDADTVALAIAQHSVGLVGGLVQLLQLDL